MSPRRLLSWAVVAVVLGAVALVPALAPRADAAGEGACSVAFQIDETLPNGGVWSMCWESREREGIVLHDVTYTPPGGAETLVLAQMNLAQIHVPYDNNVARFHDESDFGLGFHSDELTSAECPAGVLSSDGTPDVLCRQVLPTGYAYKAYDDQAKGDSLNLFSVSAIGAYNYIVQWTFDADGTIHPAVGATGRLQMYGGGPATGWQTGSPFGYAVAHMHDFYWRLDFDLAGPATDRVQELAATPSSGRQTFTNTRTAFLTEQARRVQPRSFRSWRVIDTATTNADGHRISYELLPSTDAIFRGPSYEPFTHNELYVTRFDDCEVFASHNSTGGGCAGNLSGFANGQSLAGADLVLWYGTSFHHLPRDEDEDVMDAHWSGFSLVPRDLTATYPTTP